MYNADQDRHLPDFGVVYDRCTHLTVRVCFLCRVVCQCRCRLACEFFFVRVLAATRGGGSMDYIERERVLIGRR